MGPLVPLPPPGGSPCDEMLSRELREISGIHEDDEEKQGEAEKTKQIAANPSTFFPSMYMFFNQTVVGTSPVSTIVLENIKSLCYLEAWADEWSFGAFAGGWTSWSLRRESCPCQSACLFCLSLPPCRRRRQATGTCRPRRPRCGQTTGRPSRRKTAASLAPPPRQVAFSSAVGDSCPK